jgi:hypothetical protein
MRGLAKSAMASRSSVSPQGAQCKALSTRGFRPAQAAFREGALSADALKGQVPLGLLVLKTRVNRPADEVAEEPVGLVR